MLPLLSMVSRYRTISLAVDCHPRSTAHPTALMHQIRISIQPLQRVCRGLGAFVAVMFMGGSPPPTSTQSQPPFQGVGTCALRTPLAGHHWPLFTALKGIHSDVGRHSKRPPLSHPLSTGGGTPVGVMPWWSKKSSGGAALLRCPIDK